ncbi:MAG: hypothetical protein AB1442_15715 [Nitrospirota bacterium]
MSILPEGEQLRRAVRWIAEERETGEAASLAKLIGEACIKFDLSPADAEFLANFFAAEQSKGQAKE